MGSKSRRDSHHTAISDFKSEVAKLWQRRESITTNTVISPSATMPRRDSGESSRSGRRDSTTHSHHTSRRGSGESGKSGRRDSTTAVTPPPPKIVAAKKKRRDSRTITDTPYYRQEQRPSTSSTASDSAPPQYLGTGSSTVVTTSTSETSTQALPPPTIITSSVTPPATSPTVPTTTATTPTHPLLSTRRDSTTQCGRLGRRDSRTHASPERSKHSRLQRQNTAYDESCLPPGGWSRRGSQPTALSPDVDDTGRKARRDSLSPDSASRSRRDSRSHLSPDRSGERDISPVRRSRRGTLRRQSTSIAGGRHGHRSPDSSSCSSRDPSPCNRTGPPPTTENYRPAIRRQSTTEEILIARGFRRQSTTEEMIRCRNFRRQSSQSDDCQRYRGRRDSSAQILDGTIASMTVETSSTFFDSSTQTGKGDFERGTLVKKEMLIQNICCDL